MANVSLAAAQFAEPVLFGRIVDALTRAQERSGAPAWSDLTMLLGAWVGFGLFTIVSGALIALHADRLAHRRRHAVMTEYFEHILQLAAQLSRQRPLRPADENHADWHRFAVVAVARFLPRTFRRIRFVAGAAAAVAVPELAAGAAVDPALPRVRRADRSGGAQGGSRTGRGRAPLRRSCRARLRYARQCRAGAELLAHRRGSGRDEERRCPAPRRPDAGAVLVGDVRRADAGVHHHHRACDLRRRHLAEHQRPDLGRRDRHLYQPRRDARRPARTGRGLRQPPVPGCAAAEGFLRSRRHHPDGARPPGRDRSRPRPRPGRIFQRVVLLRRQASGRGRYEFHRAARRGHRAGRSDRGR